MIVKSLRKCGFIGVGVVNFEAEIFIVFQKFTVEVRSTFQSLSVCTLHVLDSLTIFYVA